jgi:vacuolar-type H+-ATPase subunit H
MSTITDIVKIEAEAAATLAAAQKEAERIRQEGLAAAAKITADADATAATDAAALIAHADQRIKAEDDRVARENETKLAARKAQFDARAATAVEWIVNTLLTGEA